MAPWGIADVDKHKKGLTKKQKKKWVAIANAILKRTGNEGMAIATADKRSVSEDMAFMIEYIATSEGLAGSDKINKSPIDTFDIGNRHMINVDIPLKAKKSRKRKKKA